MSLAIPDPFKEPVPFGWAEKFALPVLDKADEAGIDDYEAKLRGLVTAIETTGGDPLEFEKALRIVDKRQAELRPKRQGARVDLLGAPKKSNKEAVADFDKHQILGAWSWLWPEHIAPSKSWAYVKRGPLLRVIAERTDVLRELPEADLEGDGWRLLAGSIDGRLPEIEAGSIDLILTDPPYPKESLPLWSTLGKWAAELLTPRGLLFAYSGKIQLPDVMERLGEHMTYGWMFALMLPGSGSRIMGRHMIQGWKPILAYSVMTWPSGPWADDVLRSPERDKSFLAWQQNAVPAQRLIERFTPPGAVVLDPFAGTGSTGVAALKAERKFIGIEPDPRRFKVAAERLASV